MKISRQWHGLVPYKFGLDRMVEAEQRASSHGTLLGFEFESTVTLGLRANLASDLVGSFAELKASGIGLEKVDRGGEATLHSPGQLVIYPVLNLKRLGLGVREFVTMLEEVTIKTLASYGAKVARGPCESGVFTERGKIAFIGLKIRGGVSTHGIGLNVSNDLTLFDVIRSCGETFRAHDRLHAWAVTPLISEVYSTWCEHFLSSLTLTHGGHHDLSHSLK